MRPNNHVYTPNDGRSRHMCVFLNGNPLRACVYADTKRGVVRITDCPPVPHKHGKRVLFKTLRGRVEVVPRPEAEKRLGEQWNDWLHRHDATLTIT